MSMFALTNARGETVDINNDKLLSYTPTGLGVQFTNTYSQYETYFKATKSTVTQGQFQIYILFGDVESQAYQTFSDFAQFLAYQPLTLTYTTDSGTWYRDGRLNSLTKTEIGGSTVFATDRINESFTLEFINNWYNNKTAEYKSYDPDHNLGTYGKIYGNQIADTSIQINSQGQQNKLVNTEFSPDLSGWYGGQSSQSGIYNTGTTTTGWSLDSEKYKGSNVIVRVIGVGSVGTYSDLIAVTPGLTLSVRSAYYNSNDFNGGTPLAFYMRFYDINKKYITSSSYNCVKSTTWREQSLTFTVPSNAAYVSYNTLHNGTVGTIKMSEPILVEGNNVGDYVQGLEYNHVATPAYTYAYAPYYVYQESNRPSNEKVMSLNNKSQYFGLQSGSPSVITVNGPCSVNPTWTVVQNGNVVATDGFVLTLTDNQKLVVSSYPEDQYARLYNPDGSYVDVSQLQDYTKTNFVQIPEGESTVLFYLDANSDVNITFKEERLLV
ncbi:phage distal tail protein domain-containing protein [Leuconostoc pseudomesenteroides]|uniref:phage distal tail protein domain-containing protein n=1 Tax=Leuconostoc pseudomesenteroides TaxID=33968 RepID=UPI00228678E5|nr:phage distal tail protein domain-containing protein [Leuconostoc pseudomesenteroides]WAM37827.1 phage baseplate protein [Leuconostoc pseudomesenteroides]